MKLINNSAIDSFFNEGKINGETDLCITLKKFGSDKCSDWHNYSTFYEFIFSENQDYFVNEDRIQSFFCDQDNPEAIREMWENETLKDIDFDIIIDDGKHEYIPNINFLENSYHKLKEGGFFIVEDLTLSTLNSFREKIEELGKVLKPRYIQLLEIPNSHNSIDNNILLIQK